MTFKQFRKCLFTSAMLSLALVFACSAAQAAEQWRWIRIEPWFSPSDRFGWEVIEGVTDVEFDGETFTADLKHEEEKSLSEYVLKGKINGTSVEVTETQLYTEPVLRSYKGYIEKMRDPDDPWGIDRIVVTDGLMHIEVMRNVRITEGDTDSP